MQTVRTNNESETIAIANKIGKSLKGGDVITLQGDLGSGKTTFTKGVAEVLGITQEITSPTFLIVKQHQVNHESIQTLYHIDLYRLEQNADLKNIGFQDILADPHGLTIIEWPERLKEPLKSAIAISFAYMSETSREITITGGNFHE